MEVIYCNKLHVVNVLLSRGANVHLKNRHGLTSLHFAASQCGINVFRRIFYEAGPLAMSFPDCNGWTPLMDRRDKWRLRSLTRASTSQFRLTTENAIGCFDS
jgi:hypothetical protein